MDLDITFEDCYLYFISAAMNFYIYAWIYLSQKSKVLLEKKMNKRALNLHINNFRT